MEHTLVRGGSGRLQEKAVASQSLAGSHAMSLESRGCYQEQGVKEEEEATTLDVLQPSDNCLFVLSVESWVAAYSQILSPEKCKF